MSAAAIGADDLKTRRHNHLIAHHPIGIVDGQNKSAEKPVAPFPIVADAIAT